MGSTWWVVDRDNSTIVLINLSEDMLIVTEFDTLQHCITMATVCRRARVVGTHEMWRKLCWSQNG